jgi:hypothetical protein
MGGAKPKGKQRVYAVHLEGISGDHYTYCLQAQNVEHLFKILKQKLDEDLPGCSSWVAELGGSERLNAESTKQLDALIQRLGT